MNPFDRQLPVLLLLCILAAVAIPCHAEDPKGEDEDARFIRLAETKGGSPRALEAAIVRFSPLDGGGGGVVVDLVSALHVAEPSYYEALNRRFKKYDKVLYELVAPEGTEIPKRGGERSGSAVSMLQTTMTDVLELEFQLRGIDYTAENFVHADMTPEEFAASMKRRGESVFKMFFRMMGHAMAQQGNPSKAGNDLRLLMALFSKDRALAMKRVLAAEFEDMEGSLAAINGPDGSTIITERNKVALEVLREQIEAGHKKMAIFYGAGHMADFQERLREDFGLAPQKTTWITAWDLEGDDEESAEKKAKKRNRKSEKRRKAAAAAAGVSG